MKTFQKFLEQATAVAPQPTPAKPVEKAPQTKGSPKVYDPGRGVDVDNSGRWVGKVVDTPKTKAPEQKKTTPAVTTGADPNLPAGEANPKKRKDNEFDTSKIDKDYGKTSGYIMYNPETGKSTSFPGQPPKPADTSDWPSIKKPGSGGPVLWPTPGVYRGGQGRGV